MEKYTDHPLRGATDLDSSMSIMWSFYKKHFIVLYLISVVSSIITNFLTSKLDLSAIQSVTEFDEQIALLREIAPTYVLLIAISLFFIMLISSYILEKPNNESFVIGRILKNTFIVYLPYYFAMAIMAFLGIFVVSLGMAMFILPGLFAAFYLGTIFFFSIPVSLVESRNPGNIIVRSFQLGHRNIWPNMGWVSVTLLIVIIVSVILSAIAIIPFSGDIIKMLTDSSASRELASKPAYIIVSSLLGSLVTPVVPIMAFILYFRNLAGNDYPAKEEADAEERVKVEDLYPKMPDDN